MLNLAMAGLSAGLSFLGGSSARKAQKKTQKLQIQASQDAHNTNMDEMWRVMEHNRGVADWLDQQKEVTTEARTGSDTRKSSIRSWFDVDAMHKAAEASGINPITFIRNGGIAAFMRSEDETTDTYGSTVTTTRSGHNAAASAQLRQTSPVWYNAPPISHVSGQGEVIANAGMAGLNSWNTDRVRQETQQFQRELLNTQLSAIQRSSSMQGGRSMYVPTMTTSGPTTVKGGLGLSGLLPGPLELGDRKVTSPFPLNTSIKVDPSTPDAEQWESRYGDIAQEFGGAYNLINDTTLNLTGRNIPSWIKAGMDNGWKLPAAPAGTYTVRDALRDLGGWASQFKPPMISGGGFVGW